MKQKQTKRQETIDEILKLLEEMKFINNKKIFVRRVWNSYITEEV